MSPSLDLYLLPLVREQNQERPSQSGSLLGLYAMPPPRRTARGRAADQLILYFGLAGNAPLTPEQYSMLLSRLAKTYYHKPGTVTSAMRVVAEQLNQFLLDRNLRSTGNGQQGLGLLVMAVLRGDILYLGHCGPVHSFVISQEETQYFYDAQTADRGLGLSRAPTLRYFQATLKANTFVLLSNQPGSSWTEASLRLSQSQSIESMRRRLLSLAGPDLNAVLIYTQEGQGRLRFLRHKAAFQDMARPTPGETTPYKPTQEPIAPVAKPEAAARPIDLEGHPEAPSTPRPAVPEMDSAGSVLGVSSEMPAAVDSGERVPSISSAAVQPEAPPSAQTSQPSAPARLPPTRTQPQRPAKKSTRVLSQQPRQPSQAAQQVKRLFSRLLGALAVFGRSLLNLLRKMIHLLLTGLKHVLPDESVLQLSTSTLVFLAVAIPLMVGVVGGMVYMERGRAAQYQDYYEQASQAAEAAAAKTTPGEQRAAWQSVLGLLEQADSYRVTQQTQELRSRAMQVLDELDGIERLEFQPALSEALDRSVKITRMAATATELYMLDGVRGDVYRALFTGRGYDLSPNFTCGTMGGGLGIGLLIDIAVLPRGHESGAALLGMDMGGNLMFCTPGENPLIAPMAPPLMNFGTPRALTYDAGHLYVLDPPINAVWIYRNLSYGQSPRFFFGEQIPPMHDVIDLAVNQNDLYLLHADGHQTFCTYSGISESPTRCEDPYLYTDSRPGRQGGAVIPDSLFDQIVFSASPDPSLFLLDPQNRAVYRFSLRLNFLKQFRPAQELPEGNATAFAISPGPNRLVFVAIEDEIYYAALP